MDLTPLASPMVLFASPNRTGDGANGGRGHLLTTWKHRVFWTQFGPGGVSLSSALPATAQQLWEATLSQLLLRVTRQNFDSWLRNTVGLRYEETTLVVSAPNDLTCDWLSTRMRAVVAQALTNAAGPGMRVRFEPAEPVVKDDATQPLQPSMLPSNPTPLNPRFTFSNYLEADFNRLALTSARELAGGRRLPLLAAVHRRRLRHRQDAPPARDRSRRLCPWHQPAAGQRRAIPQRVHHGGARQDRRGLPLPLSRPRDAPCRRRPLLPGQEGHAEASSTRPLPDCTTRAAALSSQVTSAP